METPKEAAIRKAWIAEIGEEKWNNLKVDERGFSDWSCRKLLPSSKWDNLYSKKKDYSKEFKSGIDLIYRPKSLSGIETNNGWHRVDEELPKETEVYITAFMNHTPSFHIDCVFIASEKYFRIQDNVKVFPTHWRKKETYPDPIY